MIAFLDRKLSSTCKNIRSGSAKNQDFIHLYKIYKFMVRSTSSRYCEIVVIAMVESFRNFTLLLYGAAPLSLQRDLTSPSAFAVHRTLCGKDPGSHVVFKSLPCFCLTWACVYICENIKYLLMVKFMLL